MAKLAEFRKAAAEFADIADFVTTYISEAHPADGWDFSGNKYKINQHTSLQERLLAASILLDDEDLRPPGTFLIDKMDTEAELLYGALPERLYIVMDGLIKYAGRRGPDGYKIDEVKAWLEAFRGKTQ